MATTQLLTIVAALLAIIGIGAVAVADHPPALSSRRSRLYPTVVTAAAAATIVANVIAWAHPAPTPGLVLSGAAVLLCIAGSRRLHAQRERIQALSRRRHTSQPGKRRADQRDQH